MSALTTTTPRRADRTSTGRRLGELAAPLVFFVLLALAWQWTAYHNRSLIPPIQAMVTDLSGRPDYYLAQLWETLQSALIGLVIGVSIAFALAVGIVHVRALRTAVMPVALLINVTPIVAISPALIVAFGFTRTPHIIVVAIVVFFPMLINATVGLSSVDPQAMDVFRTLSATKGDVLLRLRLPSSLPFVFAGLRLSASTAMLGAIISEFTGTSKGMGASIMLATSYLNLAQMWSMIFLSALTSLALLGLVAVAERMVIRW